AGIYIDNVSTSSVTTIENNIIKNISTSGEITGITSNNGYVSVRKNMFGDTATTNSIVTSGGSAFSGPIFRGISVDSDQDILVDSNIVANASATSSYNDTYGITITGSGG